MNIIIVMAPASRRPNCDEAREAIARPRAMNRPYSTSSATPPYRPNSSAYTAKMKSVVRSGMKSRCVCVPCM
ncbi:Uncharacterised protein [Bordetella pertussis]|nr:Uncharacterised protein [Bordetella pertussis]CFP56473.1 Uncharacterised protein [Bordetella pertussis]CFT95588.1 Uncharacterised protein [Bordetella pertussis]CFW37375.1 Uncharacterised protein [Bordetella pertussis]